MATKSELEIDNAEMKEQLDAANAAVAAEQEGAIALNETIKGLQDQLASLKAESNGEKVIELEAKIAELVESNGQLSAQLTDMQLNEGAEEEGSADTDARFAELSDKIEMLTADKMQAEIQRNEYRDRAIALQVRIDEKESLHGRIDNLPPVV